MIIKQRGLSTTSCQGLGAHTPSIHLSLTEGNKTHEPSGRLRKWKTKKKGKAGEGEQRRLKNMG